MFYAASKPTRPRTRIMGILLSISGETWWICLLFRTSLQTSLQSIRSRSWSHHLNNLRWFKCKCWSFGIAVLLRKFCFETTIVHKEASNAPWQHPKAGISWKARQFQSYSFESSIPEDHYRELRSNFCDRNTFLWTWIALKNSVCFCTWTLLLRSSLTSECSTWKIYRNRN